MKDELIKYGYIQSIIQSLKINLEKMEDELIKFGYVREHWNVAHNRILRCSREITHRGLNEYKVISAPDEYILKNKVDTQVAKWKEKWEALQLKNKANREKENNIKYAEDCTNKANEIFDKLDNILLHSLSIENIINWERLKKKNDFSEPAPKIPMKTPYNDLPEQPDPNSEIFTPKYNLLEVIFKSLKIKKEKIYIEKFEKALSEWRKKVEEVNQENSEIDKEYKKKEADWEFSVKEWENRKMEFFRKQRIYNDKIDEFKVKYFQIDNAAVIEYCKIVLNNSVYPDFFPKIFELEYNNDNKILIVEYELPDIAKFPRLKEVKYIASKKELKESYISDSQISMVYDNAIYQVTLRTMHELFEADAANALAAVSFNGWVKTISKATGKMENKCILSLQAKKEEFVNIQLANINPKICFKSLKGVASSKLSFLSSIQPIIQISRSDKRFVDSYAVAEDLDDRTNIALMDWEDFEHLIREIFEKEFSVYGGEVKVTQSSRDGGVDAIAFDPDPIRGGKIVIQAKRYTNTVGVSAVRDLYGTLLNEGATKGILVTTADYGSDAYKFAKNKPITLMNGSNLLYLLEKHGHQVKIDITEARKLLKEEK